MLRAKDSCRLPIACWLLVVGGCVPHGGGVEAVEPAPPPVRVLLCATWMDEPLAGDLVGGGGAAERAALGERAECAAAVMAARQVGDRCRAARACETPEFVDGQALAAPGSPWDLVLLAEGLGRQDGASGPGGGREPARMKAPFAEPILVGIGQREPGGSDATIQKSDESQRDRMIDRTARAIRNDSELLQGDAFVFAPRSGQLLEARRFEGVSRERVRAALREQVARRR